MGYGFIKMPIATTKPIITPETLLNPTNAFLASDARFTVGGSLAKWDDFIQINNSMAQTTASSRPTLVIGKSNYVRFSSKAISMVSTSPDASFFNKNFSIAGRARFNTITSNNYENALFSIGQTNGRKMIIVGMQNGSFMFNYYSSLNLVSSINITTGTDYNFVVTYNATTEIASLYVNGAQNTLNIGTLAIGTTQAGTLGTGASINSLINAANYDIYWMGFYDYILTSSNASQLAALKM